MGKGSDNASPASKKRVRAIAWGAVAVVVLALVVFGMSALSSPSRPSGSSDGGVTPSSKALEATREKSTLLYERALAAKASGDTTKAIELAQESVDANAGNERARALLVTLRSSSGGSTGDGSEPSSATVPTATAAPALARVKDIASLLPVKADGYVFDAPIAEGKDAVVSADPTAGSTDARLITHALFSVHDRGTDKAAKAFVDTVNKRLYSKNRGAVTVLGGPGYFGTDGARLASVAFARGPYAFEVVLTTLRGDPINMRDATLKLAGAFRIP